jgi:hypothetical protein
MAMQGAGGTPGGVGIFFGGLAMVAGGGYLLLQQVQVHSGFWSWFGSNTFGLTLVPLLIGIGFLFFDGKSKAGWVRARRDLHPGRHPHEPPDLLSAHEPLQYAPHAGAPGGRARADRAVGQGDAGRLGPNLSRSVFVLVLAKRFAKGPRSC